MSEGDAELCWILGRVPNDHTKTKYCVRSVQDKERVVVRSVEDLFTLSTKNVKSYIKEFAGQRAHKILVAALVRKLQNRQTLRKKVAMGDTTVNWKAGEMALAVKRDGRKLECWVEKVADYSENSTYLVRFIRTNRPHYIQAHQ